MDILGIGEAMIQLDSDAALSMATQFKCQVGGDVYNTLVAASRLGSKAGFFTQVANDGLGERLLKSFKANQIDTRYVQSVLEGKNGLYISAIKPDKTHQFLYYRKDSAASQMNPDRVVPKMFDNVKMVYASGVTQAISPSARQTVLKAFQEAKERNILVAYDPNYRPALWNHRDEAMDAVSEVLPYVDVILPSLEDMIRLYSLSETRYILDHFHLQEVPIVVIKQGSKGAVLSFKNRKQTLAAITVKEVKDTIGAGDAFNGGFLHGMLEQKSLVDCTKLGLLVAGKSIEQAGPLAGLPYAADLDSNQRIKTPV